MRRYETIIIIDPDLSDERCLPILEKLSGLITQYNGLLINTDDWGIKKLAYDIGKKSRGHYIRFDFCSEVTLIDELEHFFRVNDNILKFMTIVLDKIADIEAIKNIIAEEEQEQIENKNNNSENNKVNGEE